MGAAAAVSIVGAGNPFSKVWRPELTYAMVIEGSSEKVPHGLARMCCSARRIHCHIYFHAVPYIDLYT